MSADPALKTLSYGRFYNLPGDPTTYICEIFDGSPCDGTVLAPSTNWTVNYHSEATAGFGLLKAKASLFLTGDDSLGPLDGGAVPFPHLVSIGGRSGFLDEWIVTGGTGEGTVDLTFSVTGTSSQTAGGLGRPLFQRVPIVGGVEDWANVGNYGVASDGTATIPIAITFGEPIGIEVFFYALAQIFTAEGWAAGAAIEADFSSTATLTRIEVRDDIGAAVPSFAVDASSDTKYTRRGVLAGLDADGDSYLGALTDGLLTLRYLFGFGGATLINGALGPACTSCEGAAVAAALAEAGSTLDIDGNGELEALTDGLLVLRFLFGFTGASLTNGAVGADCSRCDPTTILGYLEELSS